MRPAARLLLALLAAVTAPAWSPAQTTAPVTSPTTQPAPRAADVITEALLADLDSNDFDTREKATRQLLADERITPAMLLERFPKARTPEQRHRLLSVAQHHFVRALLAQEFKGDQAGSVGLTQSGVSADELPDLNKPAIRVRGTFPGFPAYAHLNDGDLILAVDGQALAAGQPSEITDQFSQLVTARRMGQAVTLTVRRGDRDVQVRVALASMNALKSMYDPGSTALKDVYRQRWDEYEKRLTEGANAPTPLPVER